MKTIRGPIVALILAVFAGSGVLAQDGLYGPTDSDDAFVRVVHAVPGSSLVPVDLGATSYGRVGYGDVTPYRPVFPGMFVLRAEGREFSFAPRSGNYYTLVYGTEGFQLIEDEIHTDPARAQLVLYNLQETGSLTLGAFPPSAPENRTPVVSGVRPGGAGREVINPVDTGFVVTGPEDLATFDSLPLSRGASVSVLVMGSGEAVEVVVAEASVASD
ncbi:MAG: alginate O-acetyltransferase AlgF [Spirochaetota bacterium]